MKRKIYLHGYLGRLHPEEIVVEAATVAEAVRSLELIPALIGGAPHSVRIDGVDTDIQLFGTSTLEELHIRPLTGGAGGKGGLTQVLLGIAMVAVGFMNPTLAIAGQQISGTLILSGSLMAIGGLLQLLMPTPDADDEEGSKYLSANKNTVKIGTRAPILYGAALVYGHYLSFDVDTKNVQTMNLDGTVTGIETSGEGSDARLGEGDYATGPFTYTLWITDDTGERHSGANFPNHPWRKYASGKVDLLDPTGLMKTASGGVYLVGFYAEYDLTLTAQVSGSHVFAGDAGTTFEVYDSTDTLVPSPWNLTAGATYRVHIRTHIPLLDSDDIPVSSYQITQPGGSAENLATFSGINQGGSLNPAPVPVEVSDSVYVKYDETPLADALTPVLPVFASNITGPSNVPTSDWSV